jgi:hypothetical protein
MEDLFAGRQGYLGLKKRLYQNLNRTLGEVAISFFAGLPGERLRESNRSNPSY